MLSILSNSEMINSKKMTNICNVSHDAFGAEVVFSYLKRSKLDCRFK